MDTATPVRNILQTDNSNVFFRKLFYESKDPLLIFDFELDKTIDVNESTLVVSGYSREEFMRLGRYELTPQYSKFNPDVDLHKTFLDAHAQKVINGQTITEVGIFKRKDGTEIMAELEIIPTERKSGEAFIIIKDVTDNFKKSTLYKESERNFKSIVESTAAGITIVDLTGKHLYVSPNIEKITGFSATEMIGTPMNLYFEDEEIEKIKAYTKLLLKGEDKLQSFICKGAHKKGHTVWLQGTGTIVKDDNDKPYAVQTIFLDVSDKVLLQKELEQTKDKYQQIIESLQGIFMLVDLEGNIEYVSPNYTSIIGYDAKEVIGKKGLFIFCDEDAHEIREHSLRLLKEEDESYTSTYQANHKDGSEIWLSGTFSVIKDKEGKPSGFVSVYLDETKKVQIEKELEGTKYKYQHIIENIDGVISITDLEGKTNYISPKITDVLGYQPEELIGQNGFDLFFESEYKNLTEHAEKLFTNSHQKIRHTYKGKHKDGTARWINGVASLVKDTEGKPSGFVTIFFDISEDIALQQKLVQSENKFRALFENAIDPIIIRDLETFEVIDCNKAAIKFFGLREDDHKAKLNEFSARVSNDAGETFKEIIKTQLQVAKEKSLATFQVKYVDEESKEYIIELNLIIDSSNNSSPRCVFFLKDITEQVTAFEKIAKERKLLNAVIEGISDQIIVQDKDRNIIAVNSQCKNRFKEMHNVDIEIGTDMKSISANHKIANFDDTSEWDQKINNVIAGETILYQYSQNNDGEEKHFSLSASPLKDKDEVRGIISTIRNITELVNKNEEIEEKNKELQKYLDSNIQLENFAYIASHDLKQPLRTIISFSELLHSKKADQLDADANKYINFILESSQRLNDLISDMLAYSVIGTAGDKEILDPSILIDQVLDDLSAQITQKNAEIKIGTLPSSIKVFKSEFISLIQNLVSNSIKYCKQDIHPKIKIDSIDLGATWKFSITDNGKGIKQEHLKRIFGMFQRLEVNQDTTGTGIGLAHCKKILELHEGEIWAESKINEGTTFIFTLPK